MSEKLASQKYIRESFFTRFLNKVEIIGNKLPQPFIVFIILSLFVIVLSAILNYFEFGFIAKEGDKVIQAVETKSLLSTEGILYMLKSFITNFTSFPALGPVFLMMICVGISEKSGLIRSILYYVVTYTPKRIISAVVVLLGIMSSVAASVGYIVLIPLGALIFIGFNRHPIAGIAAAFAGVSGGWGANILLGTSDVILAGLSTTSAQVVDQSYQVAITGNWYFMIVSTFLIMIIGALVTDKIVEPRLEAYKGGETALDKTTSLELKALSYSLLAVLIYIGILVLLVYPETSFLRSKTGTLAGSPFISGLIFFIAFGFALAGCIFGLIAKRIASTKDLANMMEDSVKQIAGYMVLVLFAAQFIAYFKYSNLGFIFAAKGAHFLEAVKLDGLFAVFGLIIITALLNLFISAETVKFALLSPIFTPMFMGIGLSPELTQVAYRIGDSSTNIISPVMSFFPLIVTLCHKYNPKLGLGSLISIMLPYSICFFIAWIILLTGWYFLGFDLGPGASLFYNAIK